MGYAVLQVREDAVHQTRDGGPFFEREDVIHY